MPDIVSRRCVSAAALALAALLLASCEPPAPGDAREYTIGLITNNRNGLRNVAGFKDASEALNVTLGLVERGYSEEDIAKIWGGNFLRVLVVAERATAPGNE